MAGNPYLWSTTALTNESSDPAVNWAEGQLPGTVNSSARGMMAGLAGFIQDTNGTVSTGGSSDAYTLTSNVAHAALSSGIILGFKASFTNTGAATFALNGLTAKELRVITSVGDSALAASQIMINGHYLVRYDSAANSAAGAWVLLNPESTSAFKVGSFTRDISLASGSQAVTGVGFKSKAVIFLSVVASTSKLSAAFDDGATGHGWYDQNGQIADTYGDMSGAFATLMTDNSNFYQGVTASLDSDGFTITWTKVGTTTGTATIHYLALR